MTCPFCGLEFDPSGAEGSCAPCPLRRLACGRRIACCPRCGYRTPLPPRWLRAKRKEPARGVE